MEWDYQNYTIEVTQDQGKFHIATLDANRKTFNTLEEAKKAIDVAVRARLDTLKLPVMANDGERYVVKGINRTTSDLAFAGKVTPPGHRVYAVCDALPALLAEHKRVAQELNRLDHLINPLAVRMSRGYGRLDLSRYAQYIKTLEQEYERAVNAAQVLQEQTD